MAKLNIKKRKQFEQKTFEELVNDFQLENKIKNLSEMTIRFYNQNLVHFQRFLNEKGIIYVHEITKNLVDQFVLWLREKELKDTTINTYLRATRAILYFAMNEDYICPPFQIKLIKTDIRQKEPYTEEEIKKLLKKPDLKRCGFVEYRNWVLVNYLLETGNRLNTVINLKVADVDLENGMVVLSTVKNRKAQFNPISQYLVKILKGYIKTYGLNNEDYLFVNELGEQMTRNALQNSIRRYNKSRSVNKTSIHAFRHTFAKHYITSGGDALKLQRLLGHSTLNVTMNYVNLYGKDLKEGYEKHSIISKYADKPRMKRRTNRN
jgi:integrase/recombinase XerD